MIKKIVEYYLSLPRHRGKTRVVKLLLKALPYKNINSHYGVKLATNAKDKTNIYAIAGDYGYVIYDHIQSLPKNAIFLDIGANYGLFTNLAAQHLEHGQVLSFEPNPYIYQYFLKSRAANNYSNIVSFHCAVGETDSFLSLTYNEKHSGLSHLVKNNNDGIQVPVFNIKSWPLLSSLKNQKEIHIKIDVEGYEKNILEILLACPWASNIRSIIVEIDNKNLQEFGNTIEELYRLMNISGFKPKFGLNINHHYDEIFYR